MALGEGMNAQICELAASVHSLGSFASSQSQEVISSCQPKMLIDGHMCPTFPLVRFPPAQNSCFKNELSQSVK